jgi:hypothetical protein
MPQLQGADVDGRRAKSVKVDAQLSPNWERSATPVGNVFALG